MVKDGEYPELRIKAYAGRVLLSFLQSKVACVVSNQTRDSGTADHVLLMILGALTSMCKWFALVESAQRYLSNSEAQEIWLESLQFLVCIYLYVRFVLGIYVKVFLNSIN